MTREEFAELAGKGPIYLDGATGTNLYKAGMPKGVCTEEWVLAHADVMIELQRSYVEAGSQIVYAPTFGCNPAALQKFGLEGKMADMNKQLVAVSRKAAGDKAYVAGDMAPTGLLLESNGGEASVEEVFDAYVQQAKVLSETGVDLIGIETMMSVDETSIALDAVQSVSDLPVMCSLFVNADGTAYYGGTVYEALEILQEQGASAVGINCCNGPDQLESIVRNLKKESSIPVLAKPNAGLPHIDDQGVAVYDMGPEEFARHMKKLVDAGAGVIGGCCGTDARYIRKMKDLLEGRLLYV